MGSLPKIPPRYDKQALTSAIERSKRDSAFYGTVIRFGWFYIDPEAHPMILDLTYQEAAEFVELYKNELLVQGLSIEEEQ